MDFRFVSDLVSILTHFFIKNRMKPMTAVGTKTEMNCFFRIASSETPLRSGYTEVDVRCKFIIKLDKPFGFDPESKTLDSARRFFCFENTPQSRGCSTNRIFFCSDNPLRYYTRTLQVCQLCLLPPGYCECNLIFVP